MSAPLTPEKGPSRDDSIPPELLSRINCVAIPMIFLASLGLFVMLGMGLMSIAAWPEVIPTDTKMLVTWGVIGLVSTLILGIGIKMKSRVCAVLFFSACIADIIYSIYRFIEFSEFSFNWVLVVLTLSSINVTVACFEYHQIKKTSQSA